MDLLEHDFCSVSIEDLNVVWVEENITSQNYDIVAAVPGSYQIKGDQIEQTKVMLFLQQKGTRK